VDLIQLDGSVRGIGLHIPADTDLEREFGLSLPEGLGKSVIGNKVEVSVAFIPSVARTGEDYWRRDLPLLRVKREKVICIESPEGAGLRSNVCVVLRDVLANALTV
jgi:hypothetical protein